MDCNGAASHFIAERLRVYFNFCFTISLQPLCLYIQDFAVLSEALFAPRIFALKVGRFFFFYIQAVMAYFHHANIGYITNLDEIHHILHHLLDHCNSSLFLFP